MGGGGGGRILAAQGAPEIQAPSFMKNVSSTEGISRLNKKSSGSPPGPTFGGLAKVLEKMSKRCQKVVAGGRRHLFDNFGDTF